MSRFAESGRRRGKGRPASGLIATGVALLATAAATPAAPVPEKPPVTGGELAPVDGWPRARVADPTSPPAPRRPAAVGNPGSDVDAPRFPAVFVGVIPNRVLDAYLRARDAINLAQPGCHLPVELLAAIGKVETGHALGGQVDARGTTVHPILGPVLDGRGFAAIADTDDGQWDGDATWDRAVGPLQFIPGTWKRWASDGNGDRRADPHNVYDASQAAARYLCAAHRDLGTPQGLDEAILSYNNSTSYRNLVLRWMATYAAGTIAVPDATGTPVQAMSAPPTRSTPPASGGTAQPTSTTPPPTAPGTTPPPNAGEPTPPPTHPTTPPATGPASPIQGAVCGAGSIANGLLGPILGTPVLPRCPSTSPPPRS